jgi:hypothetical protein
MLQFEITHIASLYLKVDYEFISYWRFLQQSRMKCIRSSLTARREQLQIIPKVGLSHIAHTIGGLCRVEYVVEHMRSHFPI